jgi:methyl-accepting chemotaxis protein
METPRNYSIASLLIGLFLAGIVGIAVILTLVMLLPLRSEIYDSAQADSAENVRAMRNTIADFYDDRATFITAVGVGTRAMVDSDTPDINGLQSYLARLAGMYADILVMYFTSNGKWNTPGNYVVESNKYIPKDNWDNTTTPWFRLAQASPDKLVCTEPYRDAMTGKLCLTMSHTVRGASGQILGVIACDFLIDSLNKVLKEQAHAGSVAYLLNDAGKYLTNTNPDKVMTVDFFTDNSLQSQRAQVLSKGEHSANTGVTFLHSVDISRAGWYLVSTTPVALVFANANRVLLRSILLLVVFSALITGVLVAIIHRIVRPITTVSRALRDIAKGEGDLTQRIHITAHNEVGELAEYFNQTMRKIKNMVILIKKQAEALSSIGQKLSNSMTTTAAAVDEITSNIESVKNQVSNQSTAVEQANTTMGRIGANIDTMTGQIDIQGAAVEKSSAAIEEMLANIKAVTKTLEKNAASVQSLIEASNVGRSSIHNVSVDIQEIAKESEGLLQINAVIENIASQTNLLSMNAAIEAAHAGESGKGFSVVADEIRKLAESSGEQSKTISVVLKKIKASIDKIGGATEAILQKFAAIDEGVNTVSAETANIKNAMEEQNVGSQQILEVITKLDETTEQVKASAADMRNGSQEIVRESQNLEAVTSEIANSMKEMALGAEQIDSSVNQVNGLSDDNEESIKTLLNEVERFKVE